MELFHEMYGCYYNAVAEILRESHEDGLSREEISHLVEERAFSESGLHLLPRLLSGEWDLLREEGGRFRSKLRHRETALPLTTLQKAWLKALVADPRIQLFLDVDTIQQLTEQLQHIEPLYHSSDFHLFDAASDGDPYHDEGYIQRFRTALRAVRQRQPLLAVYHRGKGGETTITLVPEHLLYSAKDDKFRLVGKHFPVGKHRRQVILNLARLTALTPWEGELPPPEPDRPFHAHSKSQVTIAISEERNALERTMLQFASYQKTTVFDEEANHHICEITYDPLEETELLIRILSFGPVIQVLGPDPFLKQVQKRVAMQFHRME